jgi:GTP-binding protein Era
MTDPKKSCGFACILGLPNAGKSTLVNYLVGQKVSIVSHRVQTTRTRVLGIAIHDNAQVLLVDTPGVFDAQKTMERAMVAAAYDAIENADCVVHLVDASKKNAAIDNAELLKRLPHNIPVILVLNKIDQTKKPDLLALAQALNDQHNYKSTYMISALKGHGTDDLLKGLADVMPVGPWHFDGEEITDMPMRLMAAEITREKIFNRLYRELPQSSYVETESWENFDNGDIKITQLVYVQRDSQKAIVLGKGGSQIKNIGQESREELEEILGTRVHLKLFVKVQENWSEQAEILQKIGLIE